MTSRIPSTLSPYITVPPRDSLTLVTSVLGASANWVIHRYLFAALDDGKSKRSVRSARYLLGDEGAQQQQNSPAPEDFAVILVSWMRDWDFWKTEARRAVGLDLARLQQEGRFAFVDGLTELFAASMENTSVRPPTSAPRTRSDAIPLRTSTPSRGPPATPTTLAPTASTTSSITTLKDATLAHLQTTLTTVLASIVKKNVLLIFDTPTVILTTSQSVTSATLSQCLLNLRSLPSVHSTVLHLPADRPFLSAAAEALHAASDEDNEGGISNAGNTPLDTEMSAFIVGVAHQARVVLGVRKLGTGWAGDVSGVVRVTRGGGSDENYGGLGESEEIMEAVEEGEWLYHVAGDGGVKVWARGAGME